MWKSHLTKNRQLSRSNKHVLGSATKQRRSLQIETLETRNLLYADPVALMVADTPVAAGQLDPAASNMAVKAEPTVSVKPTVLGPVPEPFITGNLPQPDRVELEVPANDITPSGEDGTLFPWGKPTPPNRFVPTPIGLFPDGSVRPVHTKISPIVIEHLDQHQTGPIRESLHRPGVALGAPTRTLAGSDPRLLEYMTLEENWDAAQGPLVHSKQAIEISPENLLLEVPQIYKLLERFSVFDQGNIATVTIHEPGILDSPRLQGHRFGVFTVNTVSDSMLQDPCWSLLNTLQLIINEPAVAVRLHSDPTEREIFAVTLEKHMLVGARVWRVYEQESGWVRIETEAWEHRNGIVNDMIAEVAGRAAMEEVWTRYLQNLGEAASLGEGRFAELPSNIKFHPHNQPNPWKGRADHYRQILKLPPPLNPLTTPEK